MLAPSGGVVTFAGAVPGSGLCVTVTTPDGLAVSLTHLGSLDVAKGAPVDEGDAVGTIGPSGNADWPQPYVHLGIRVASEQQGYLDPESLLPARTEAPSPPPPVSPPPSQPAPTPPPVATVPVAVTPTPTQVAPPPTTVAAPPATTEIDRGTAGRSGRAGRVGIRRRDHDRLGAGSHHATASAGAQPLEPTRSSRRGATFEPQLETTARTVVVHTASTPRVPVRVAVQTPSAPPLWLPPPVAGAPAPQLHTARHALTAIATAAAPSATRRAPFPRSALLLAAAAGALAALLAAFALLAGVRRAARIIGRRVDDEAEDLRGTGLAVCGGLRHLGHAAAYVPFDVFARYHRLKGNDVLMVSGTDEHGTPIMVAADKEGKSYA